MSHEFSDDAVPFADFRVPCAVLPARHQLQSVGEAHLPRHRRQEVHAKTVKPRIAGVVLFLVHHHVRHLLSVNGRDSCKNNEERFWDGAPQTRIFTTGRVGADHIEQLSTWPSFPSSRSSTSLYQNGRHDGGGVATTRVGVTDQGHTSHALRDTVTLVCQRDLIVDAFQRANSPTSHSGFSILRSLVISRCKTRVNKELAITQRDTSQFLRILRR